MAVDFIMDANRRPLAQLPQAVALALALLLPACRSEPAPAGVAGALSPDDINLVFVVSPDLAYQTAGDVSAATGHLTPQGLQRSLQLAGFLKHQVLGDRNVTRISALQPMTHPQTASGYPDLTPLTYIQQFAMLNETWLTSTGGYNSPLYLGYSSPINTSPIDPAGQGFALPWQGLVFDGASTSNLTIVEKILSDALPGFYLFSAPWETVSALMAAIQAKHQLAFTVPPTYGGSDQVLAISFKASGGATLTTYDAQLSPAATYPALPSPVARAACPSATSTPRRFTILAPDGSAGTGVPQEINRNQTVYLVRHAEAHPNGDWDDGNYVAAGQWRALALADALRDLDPAPTMVWSVDPSQTYPGTELVEGNGNFSYVRPSLTVAPYAIANDLPVQLVYDIQLFEPGSAGTTVQRFFFGGRFSGTTTLLAWEHAHYPLMVDALLQAYAQAAPAPAVYDWSDGDYDSIWRVQLDAQGNLTIDNALCEGIDSARLPVTAPPF